MKNEMMETNQTGFLALQDFDLANVICAEMDGLSAAFQRSCRVSWWKTIC